MTSWRSWEKLPGLLSQLHDLGDSGFHRFQKPTLWRHLAVSSSCLKFQHKPNMILIYIYDIYEIYEVWNMTWMTLHVWNIWNMTCITLTYSHIWHIWKICWFVRINSTWFSHIYIYMHIWCNMILSLKQTYHGRGKTQYVEFQWCTWDCFISEAKRVISKVEADWVPVNLKIVLLMAFWACMLSRQVSPIL